MDALARYRKTAADFQHMLTAMRARWPHVQKAASPAVRNRYRLVLDGAERVLSQVAQTNRKFRDAVQWTADATGTDPSDLGEVPAMRAGSSALLAGATWYMGHANNVMRSTLAAVDAPPADDPWQTNAPIHVTRTSPGINPVWLLAALAAALFMLRGSFA